MEATANTPRTLPVPNLRFLINQESLSTKKEKQTPTIYLPRKPVVKSAPHLNGSLTRNARLVSFRDSHDLSLSKVYDESKRELYFDQCFEVIWKLGQGSFGEVFKVKCKEDGKFYAVKRSRQRFRGKADRLRKLQEVAKHEQLPPHENCIKFYKAWEEKNHLYIQTELCERSLNDLSHQNHDIPEYLVWNYLVDLLLAVKHLHDHNLIHMDIKPENIFIDKNGICKLGDFGLVIDLSKNNLADSDAVEGDPKYLAPEGMQSTFTKAGDIFSLGITILELSCDIDLPNNGELWHRLRNGMTPHNSMEKISPELQKIIKLMMTSNYRKRPTVDEILSFVDIKNVRRKRKYCLLAINVVSKLQEFWHIIISKLARLCSIVLNPIRTSFYKTRTKTPPPTPVPSPFFRCQNPFDFDCSISDDDCFNDTTATNLSVPKFSMDFSNNDSPVSSKRQINSTPTSQRRKIKDISLNTSDLQTSFKFRGNPADIDLSPVQPEYLNKSRLGYRSTLFDQSLTGRRNLNDVFDAVSSEDEEIFE